MRQISLLMLLAVILFSACNNPSFKKGKEGLEYKIISKGNGPKVRYGDYMQMHFSRYYNTGTKDSLLDDSRNQGLPFIEKLDSLSAPPAYFEILKKLKKGDSVVVRILVDTLFKKSPEQMPPYFKKGHYILSTLKLLNVFKTKEEADKARTVSIVEMQKKDSIDAIAQTAKDDKILADYFAKNNIKAVKAPLGAYVQVIQPGKGNNIDTSSIVSVNYTGRLLDGIVFDSNTDPSRGFVYPLIVNFTNDPSPALGLNVIKGWKDGMTLLNKGAKAKLYVPSPLAYGKQQKGQDIPPNSILVFDVEIVDILDKARAVIAMGDREKKMAEMQKRYMDSMQRSIPDTSKKR